MESKSYQPNTNKTVNSNIHSQAVAWEREKAGAWEREINVIN